MKLSDLHSYKIGVLGFGREGQAVFSYLKKHGLTAKIFDENPEAISVLKEAEAPVEFISGENYLDDISHCTLLFRSPGIWRNHPKILEAENNGIVITSQTKWFFENSPAKIIGVTGTKGKGTTSSLIYETLKAAGKNAFLTGNIGKVQPLEFLEDLSETDLIVYELSSFQLQDLTQSPSIGVCLMTTSDHLNHHSDLKEYHSAKSAVTAFQTKGDIAIYNADYEASNRIGQMGNGNKFAISAKDKPTLGAYISGERISSNTGGQTLEMDFVHRKLRGAHNLENIAASVLACLALNIDAKIIEKTANEFAGLEHRLQYVGSFEDVAYYNDSISTVPDTTIAALNAFIQPIHLLLGGSEKGLSYDRMVKDISQRSNIASITLLGETGKTIEQLLKKSDVQFPVNGPFTNLSEAISAIKGQAKAGEVVLLSPASASFDMFQNYADRGNQFVELVKAN
jgi:UDP-N-acetylmuramoylalanine--D-glutamate ligase